VCSTTELRARPSAYDGSLIWRIPFGQERAFNVRRAVWQVL